LYDEFPGFWTRVNELNIHYKCTGTGSPVILVHGGGNDWHEWISNIAFLSQFFQVYAVDLPGFGLSQMPDGPVSIRWSVEFLKSFMERLRISRAHVIGHSLGAMISIALAAQYPELINKLVIIDSGGLGKISRKGQFLISIFRIIDLCRGQKKGPRYQNGHKEEWLVLDQLPKIKSPVLIVWGQKDLYLPISHSHLAQSKIPDSQLHIFPHCGHAPQRECSEIFNNLVLQFLG